jgi:hypothetical protein
MALRQDRVTALESEITHLRALDLEALRARWRTSFGRRAPAHLPRHLLLRMLAYGLQAQALGDLDAPTLRRLGRLAGAGAGGSKAAPAAPTMRAGTLLVREWDGVLHRVMALEEGFAWNGATFRSLSQVARAITGTRWSGPRFFGLCGEAR